MYNSRRSSFRAGHQEVLIWGCFSFNQPIPYKSLDFPVEKVKYSTDTTNLPDSLYQKGEWRCEVPLPGERRRHIGDVDEVFVIRAIPSTTGVLIPGALQAEHTPLEPGPTAQGIYRVQTL